MKAVTIQYYRSDRTATHGQILNRHRLRQLFLKKLFKIIFFLKRHFFKRHFLAVKNHRNIHNKYGVIYYLRPMN